MPLQLSPHSLLHTLYAVYLEHERCGDLDSAVEKDRVWTSCMENWAVTDHLGG